MDDGNHGRGSDAVVEWAPFRVAPGISEAMLLDGADGLQRDFLEHQKGFIRRELLRGSGDQWVDLVYWQDQASADAAMEAANSSQACAAYFQLLAGADPADGGAGVLHMRRVRSYEITPHP